MLRTVSMLMGLVVLASSLGAQQQPAATAPFAMQLSYVLEISKGGFHQIRGDSVGPGAWRVRWRFPGTLDDATTFSASSVNAVATPRADGRAGTETVAVLPLAIVPPGDSVLLAQFRKEIGAFLHSWHPQTATGGSWLECADPNRGREVLLAPGRTAGGQFLILLSVRVHADPDCS